MRFAEVFLRLGCALVGWMLIFTYAVWLAALHAMGCGPDGDEMHALLLGLAPVAAGCAFMLRMTRPFPDIHRMLGWLGVPLLLLLPFVLRNTWAVFSRTSIEGTAICSDTDPATWQIAWAPAQLITVLLIALLVIAVWRHARIEKA
jgi:hypothetical protein